jgi:hypothetical protein
VPEVWKAPLLRRYSNGGVPPSALPVKLPLDNTQEGCMMLETLKVGAPGAVSVAFAVAVHRFASRTVIVYAPEPRFENVPEVWKAPPFKLY